MNWKSILRTFAFLLTVCFIVSNTAVYAAPVSYGEELAPTEDTSYSQTFSDVPTEHWAFTYIADLVSRGAISGYPDGKFRPSNRVTRAEFAKIMVLAAGLTAKKSNYSSFADIKVTDWCSPFVETAKDYLTGYTNSKGQALYKPNTYALREDIAVAAVKLKGYDLRLADISMIQAMFTDFEGISTNSQKYVALAVENGLMSGFPDDTFRAQATITRAEVAAILWRAFQYGDDTKITDDTPAVNNNEEIPEASDEEDADTNEDTASVKYSVETLAYTSVADSMVVTPSGDIYFINKNKVMKLSEGKISTVADGETDFAFEQTVGGIVNEVSKNQPYWDSDTTYLKNSDTAYYFDRFTIKGLVYDSSSDKVYALGYFKTDPLQRISASHFYVGLTSLYDINNLLQPAATYYTFSVGGTYDYLPDGYMITADNGSILFSGDDYDTSKGSVLYRFMLGNSKFIEYPNSGISSFATAAALSPDMAVVYNTSSKIIIQKYSLASETASNDEIRIKGIEGSISAYAYYNGNFYFWAGNAIYQIGADKSLNEFISSDEIKIKDNLSLGSPAKMLFDDEGNIIFFDSKNGAIRRINVS